MNIGMLKTIKDREGEWLQGDIVTLALSVRLILYPNREKRSERDPDYLAFTVNLDGQEARIGAAWLKRVQAKGREGEEFLSITLDDPSFPARLNIAAFKSKEPGTWTVDWRRRQDQARRASAPAVATSGGSL